MKLLLAITCLLIFANCVFSHGIRAKRGFSEAQQKKFLDAINRDRRKIEKVTGVKMVPLTYYPELERRAEAFDCREKLEGDMIQLDSVGREIYDILEEKRVHTLPEIFDPTVTEIGCAKKNCPRTFSAAQISKSPKAFKGTKTFKILGICLTDFPGFLWNSNETYMEKLHRTILPPPYAYGDILGIPGVKQESRMNEEQGSGVGKSDKDGAEQGSGAGSVFSLTISLLLVLYI